MLNSLEIKNFRNLKNLKINSLGRINLFTGKNNTGKSTILEAIAIYATGGSLNVIYELLDNRGEDYQSGFDKNLPELAFKTFSSLYPNRQVGFSKTDIISIGNVQKELVDGQQLDNEFISLRLVRYYEENEDEIQGPRRIIIEDKDPEEQLDYKLGIEIFKEGIYTLLPLRKRPVSVMQLYRFSQASIYQLIGTRNIDSESNSKLWDNIILSEKESYVIDALRIIEPNVERIAFIEENKKDRTAVVKLNNSNNILPLRSMGDGINRILTIILALVNLDNNGYLLIDEFENGLHHTAQEKLWEIIFKLAETLNIQVFATTHSEDCISGFEKTLNSAQNKLDGKLIRLDSKNGEIIQVEFDANELKIANENDIEIR